ncbi:hypothetical protein SAMN05660816_04837 [Niastella yeongjuensis]|nr:hypothetical protein SAMN05660816_04837 [Niastella yeongjuensis]
MSNLSNGVKLTNAFASAALARTEISDYYFQGYAGSATFLKLGEIQTFL